MDDGSGVWKFLLTVAFFGVALGFWFNHASSFAEGKNIDLERRSILPVACFIVSDSVGGKDQSAQAYFWQGNVYLGAEIRTEDHRLQIHQIVKPAGTAYVWRGDSQFGDIKTEPISYSELIGNNPNKDWFCYPWVFVDFGKFTPPASIQFE
jgi:hypothetical protein